MSTPGSSSPVRAPTSSSPIRPASSSPKQTRGTASPAVSGSHQGRPSSSPRRPSSNASPHATPGSHPHTPGADSEGYRIPLTPSSSRRGNLRRQEFDGGDYRRRVELPSDGMQRASTPVSPSTDRANENGNNNLTTMYDSTVVWGTTVNVQETMDQVQVFVKEFKLDDSDEPLYMRLLQQILASSNYNLNVDAGNVYKFSSNLYDHLVRFPQEVIPIFDLAINNIYIDMDPTFQDRIQVRIFNLNDVTNMRNLSPKDIDTLVSMKGMVIRSTAVIPDMRTAFFKCLTCDHSIEVEVDRGRISEPELCEHCSAKKSMSLIHNRSVYKDKQLVKLQEAPETIPEGETPQTVSICVYDQLIDVAKPGDRVCVTGIYRAMPIRPNPRMRTFKSVYKTYIDSIHFQKTEKGRLGAENAMADKESEFFTEFDEGDDIPLFTEDQEEKLINLSKDPEIIEKLVRSLAPSIWELDDTKKGVLCQLFGGCNKSSKKAGNKRFRGELNVLLVGDPGTSKSQLLHYVHKLAPRGIYTSGKGSSAVGLTAYVTRDPDTRDIVLESGALVLSDRGICCIDEFDKMDDSTRSVLHEAMEQQTVSVAKAGIICTLNARSSILAAANPVESKYNPRLSVVENIQLPPTLMSRFDLIYLILDKPNPTSDRKLARHIVSMYYENATTYDQNTDYIPIDLLTEYISYARQKINPEISDEACNELVDGYMEMRRASKGKGTISATPRQLESLVRLSEAHARMRFSNVVEKNDVNEAIRLMRVATQQAATDPRTGQIDMGMITTGMSVAAREKSAEIAAELRKLIEQRTENKYTMASLRSELTKTIKEFSDQDLKVAIKELEEQELIVTSDRNRQIIVRKATA